MKSFNFVTRIHDLGFLIFDIFGQKISKKYTHLSCVIAKNYRKYIGAAFHTKSKKRLKNKIDFLSKTISVNIRDIEIFAAVFFVYQNVKFMIS